MKEEKDFEMEGLEFVVSEYQYIGHFITSYWFALSNFP
jgi:hypothetical protein